MAKLAIDGGRPVRDQFIVFGAPVLDDAEIDEVVDTLRSGWIGTGPKTQRFEAEFARYVEAPHAIGVNSCTAALHLALIATGIGPEDEVITTPLTFVATANAIVHCGARPVFVDVDPLTLNLDPARVADACGPRTRAVLPVHFGGLAADLDAIRAASGGLPMIEDAAHAVGARHRGRPIGGHGGLTCFSFYANKNLTTAEGGMITFGDDELVERLTALRLHGLSRDAWKRYKVQSLIESTVKEPGYKYNLTDLQSSLGIHQLRKQERFLERREELAAIFDTGLSDVAGVTLQRRPAVPPGAAASAAERHALHLYVVIVDAERFTVDRDRLVVALRAENIGVGIHYDAVHLEPFYREKFPAARGSVAVAERVGRSILSLPLTPAMSDGDADDVVTAVHKVLDAYRR